MSHAGTLWKRGTNRARASAPHQPCWWWCKANHHNTTTKLAHHDGKRNAGIEARPFGHQDAKETKDDKTTSGRGKIQPKTAASWLEKVCSDGDGVDDSVDGGMAGVYVLSIVLRDLDGNWYKDENAEFESDEDEPPPPPPSAAKNAPPKQPLSTPQLPITTTTINTTDTPTSQPSAQTTQTTIIALDQEQTITASTHEHSQRPTNATTTTNPNDPENEITA